MCVHTHTNTHKHTHASQTHTHIKAHRQDRIGKSHWLKAVSVSSLLHFNLSALLFCCGLMWANLKPSLIGTRAWRGEKNSTEWRFNPQSTRKKLNSFDDFKIKAPPWIVIEVASRHVAFVSCRWNGTHHKKHRGPWGVAYVCLDTDVFLWYRYLYLLELCDSSEHIQG